MNASKRDQEMLCGRWRAGMVLKRDVFSIVERGRFLGPDGEVDAVLRRTDEVPWWARFVARHFLRREVRALAIAGKLGIAPPLLFAGDTLLVRGYIHGVALKIAHPLGDRAYFRSARAALRALHRAGVAHNDLAKEQNWLRGPDSRAYLTDFQLAMRFAKRGRLFRVAAYEDIRHLLKHKRRYVPEALTPTERRVVARKALHTRIWMASGKRIYLLITRGVLRVADFEGGGPRIAFDAPEITTRLKAHPQVRDVAVVAFPDRMAGTGLYAFVEAGPDVSEASLRNFIGGAAVKAKPPEHIQIVGALPRRAAGKVDTEILQLVAMNQLDNIDSLIASDSERAIVDQIVTERQNFSDRFVL